MELYSEADKTIWEEKYMPVSLKKGQKVSLTKGNPGLKNVVVGIGWDINAFDTGGDFDLDAAAFCLTDSGRVSDSNDFVFYGNLVHPSGAVQHMGDNLTGAGSGTWKRWTWPSCSLLYGITGNTWIRSLRLRYPLPLRNVQTEDQRRFSGGSAG